MKYPVENAFICVGGDDYSVFVVESYGPDEEAFVAQLLEAFFQMKGCDRR